MSGFAQEVKSLKISGRTSLGILKVQADRLDLAYLNQWARELHVEDLLEKAFNEANR